MKTQTNPKNRNDQNRGKASKPENAGRDREANVQREADTRSRGDAPSANKPDERSPKTENL